MISFSPIDIIIISAFFLLVLAAGFMSHRKNSNAEEYLLSGRSVGLFLFILTNVATWYGGILGVGEFTYRYGLVSWFTQGLPYYIFALIFAFLFAGKIRESNLFTIPDKLEESYGRNVGMLSALIIFILVSPAPYLLMMGNLISMIFDLNIFISLFIAIFLSASYLFFGGYRSDLFTDAVEFFVMFLGFAVIIYFSIDSFGSLNFLKSNLPGSHLDITGGTSLTFIIVWFLIALWTFTDPGFHQRCYAAKSKSVAKWGIVISIFLWALFDFLTTSTGLFARAALPNLENPVMAFPMYAEMILGEGYKGLFYAALFATILSTLNSFLFLSATTFGRDFIYKIKKVNRNENSQIKYTRYGLAAASLISILLAGFIDSVIQLWYTIGTICIPGIIILIAGAYYEKLRVSSKFAAVEMITGISVSILWLVLRPYFSDFEFLSEIEPMIFGMTAAVLVHVFGMFNRGFFLKHKG